MGGTFNLEHGKAKIALVVPQELVTIEDKSKYLYFIVLNRYVHENCTGNRHGNGLARGAISSNFDEYPMSSEETA